MSNVNKTSNDDIDLFKEKRKEIEKRVLIIEKKNYNQKEFGKSDMIEKIKKIIEEVVNR